MVNKGVIIVDIKFAISSIAVTMIIAGFASYIIKKKGYQIKPLGVGSFFLICLPLVMGIGGIGRLEIGVYGVFAVSIVIGGFLAKLGFKKN